MRIPDHVSCVCLLRRAFPLVTGTDFSFSEEKLRLVLRPVFGGASLPERDWAGNRVPHISSGDVDLGGGMFYGSYKRGVGAGVDDKCVTVEKSGRAVLADEFDGPLCVFGGGRMSYGQL